MELNQTELLIAVIKGAVKEAVAQALEKEIKPLKEEVNKVKALSLKILKEQANLVSGEGRVVLQEETPRFRQLGRATPEVSIPTINKEVASSIPKQVLIEAAAFNVNPNNPVDAAYLPDIDIDPAWFLKPKK